MEYTATQAQKQVIKRVFFPQPYALIPTIDNGETQLCQWGRRSEQENEGLDVPITGWARMESLEKSYWQRHQPDYVLIPALRFCEKPSGFKKSAWYPDMAPDTFLMGLRLLKGEKSFVYVVTCVPEHIFRDIDRVPVIVNKEFEPQEPLELDEQGQMGLF